MADMRCPTCNRINPAEAQICRFCQSPLYPANSSSASQDSGDDSDWLSALRASSGSEPFSEGEEVAGEVVPDWLSDIAPTPQPSAAADEGDGDWLAGLRGGKTSASSESEGDEDWLARLSDNAASTRPEPQEELPAWLSGFTPQQDEPPQREEPASTPPQPAIPAAWGTFEDEESQDIFSPKAQADPSPAEDLPDWLSGFAPQQDEPPQREEPASTPPQPAIPAAWGAFEEEESQDIFSPKAQADPSSTDDLPDWLREAQESPIFGVGSAASEEDRSPAMAFDESLFTDAASGTDTQPTEPVSEMDKADSVGFTGWLGGPPTEPRDEETRVEKPFNTAELNQLRSELTPVDQPDWGQNDFGAAEISAALQAEEDSPVLPSVQPASTDDNALQWLSNLGTQAEEKPQQAQPSAFMEDLPAAGEPVNIPNADSNFDLAGDLPDWLGEFEEQASQQQPSVSPLTSSVESPAAFSEEELPPFDIDLPEWLGESTPATPESSRMSEETFAGLMSSGSASADSLAPTELPSWVQAMRPMEAVISTNALPPEVDQREENAGPLAGMRGILPADNQVIQYRKPPVYTTRLRLTEKQRNQMALLDGLLAREDDASPAAPVFSQAPMVVQRVIVALFLLVVLGGMLMLNTQDTLVPGTVPVAMKTMLDEINALPPDAPVLVAVDYEPGLAGEMELTSRIVLDHLMTRQVDLIVLSTVPTGPALANQLLLHTQERQPNYDLANRTVNLGYLPGGTISLIEFALNPQRAAPWDVAYTDAWSHPALAKVSTITDFAAVIVITDRAETGRAWVEQVQPLLGDVPLMMATSAQAGPLMQPYIESGQVSGNVTGVMGGTLYGAQTGRQADNLAFRYWRAFQVGMLLAFLLLLVGAIFSLVVASVSGKGKAKRA